MTTIRCTVCKNPVLRNAIDPLLDDGATAVGISRHLGEAGLSVSEDIINRHRTHYKPERTRAKGERKRDFAIFVRDRVMDAVEKLPQPEDDAPDIILNKDLQSAIQSGLKAQTILDNREKVRAKQGNAELAFAIIAMLTGNAAPQETPLLDDGLTIEGEFEEVEDGEAD